MEYLSVEHERKHQELLQSDNTHPTDRERQSLFYILSGNEALYQKKRWLYDNKKHQIILYREYKRQIDLSSSAQALVLLGFHLYNGADPHRSNINNIFFNLDEHNKKLAINAIRIRFQ